MRFEELSGAAVQLRGYTGNRTISGVETAEKGNQIPLFAFSKNSSSNDVWISSKDADIMIGEWFIIRVEMTNYTEGDNVIVSIFDEETGEFVSKVTLKASDLTDVTALTAFVFITYMDTNTNHCMDYVYVGAKPTSYGAEKTANPVISYADIQATITPIK